MQQTKQEETRLLNVENLVLHFRASKGVVQAVDGVDFHLDYNEAVVIIGESGCGKTSLAKAILRLLPRNVHAYTGKIYLEGTDIMALPDDLFGVRCAGSRCRWCRRPP
jgi:peptide/nickel transport system ATP-binding protein